MTDVSPKSYAKALDTIASFFSDVIEVHNEDTGSKEKLDANRSLIKTKLGNEIWKLQDMLKFATDTQSKIKDRLIYQTRNLGSRDISAESLDKTAGQMERQNYRVALCQTALAVAHERYAHWVGEDYSGNRAAKPKSVADMSPAELRAFAAIQASEAKGVETDVAA